MEEYTDDEDFNELVNMHIHPRQRKIFRDRINHLEYWSDEQFLERFRLSKPIVQMIIEDVTPQLLSPTTRSKALSPTEKVLATLRFLATGSFLQVIGDFCGINKGTASRCINECLNVLGSLRPQFIEMPDTPNKIALVRQGFYDIARFPRCIGAIDCSHVKIQSPGGADAENYRNRKGFFSINVQGICDAELRINNIVSRWPGSTADAIIFYNSNIRRDMEMNVFLDDSILVGDSGYGVSRYLLTPLGNPNTPAQNLYNESQIRTRNPIERCFGVLKRRFPVLALGIRLNLPKVEKIVVTTAILHNIAVNSKDHMPPVNPEVEAAINLLEDMNIDDHRGYRINDNEITRQLLINDYFQHILLDFFLIKMHFPQF